MRIILTTFILLFMLGSCNQGQEETYDQFSVNTEASISMPKSYAPPPPPEAPDVVAITQPDEGIEKKIIRDGRMGLQVKNLVKAKKRIDSLVKSSEGYYGRESLSNTDWESAYTLQIRVPTTRFEALIASIESGTGELQYKEIDARDVTDQFIDLETRLENKRSYLKRYKDLLSKAKSVKEILEIEESIRKIEEEVESTVGRLKYLSDQVDYSSLELRIAEEKEFKYKPEKQDSFFERFKQSLSNGWYMFISFLLFVIRLWPFWIVVPFLIYLGRRIIKLRKSNK